VSDCEDLRDALKRSAAADLEPRLMAHAEHCPSCERLFEDPGLELVNSVPVPADARALWQNMPEALARESRGLAPLRNLSTTWRRFGALLGVVALGVLVWGWVGRIDRAVLPWGAFYVRWLPGAGLAVLCAELVLRPPYRRALPGEAAVALLVAAVIAGAAPALLPELHRAHSASVLGVESDLAPRAAACFGAGLLLGVACLGWVALFLQGSRRLGELPLGAWALFVASQSSLLSLHCPLTAPLHLAWGHASVGIVVAAGVGAWRAARC
jgi:hypothetical protein